MDGLNQLIDAVENKIQELSSGVTDIGASSEIFARIMNDPDLDLGEPDENGEQEVSCCGKSVGWVNASKGIGCLTNIKGSRAITASEKITSRAQLENAIAEVLDSDICAQVVEEAFSSTGTFEESIFTPSDEFFDVNFANKSPKEIAKAFFDGEDLDDDGPANPDRDWFRLAKKGVQSTDYPGDYYLDELYDDILNYIMDNIEDTEFPDYIQELIDEYLENNEEE